MTIDAVSSISSSYAQPANTDRKTVRQLFDSIQSGDLSAAQQAYATLTSGSSGLPQTSPLATDLGAIGQALQSGDITSAQQALAKLQGDAQKAGQTRHHHYHHHAQSNDQATTDTTTTPGQIGATNSTFKLSV